MFLVGRTECIQIGTCHQLNLHKHTEITNRILKNDLAIKQTDKIMTTSSHFESHETVGAQSKTIAGA